MRVAAIENCMWSELTLAIVEVKHVVLQSRKEVTVLNPLDS